MNENITTVFLRRCCRTAIANSSLYRYDHGQILKIEGVELPTTYTVDFCNAGDSETMPMIGNADGVAIPDDFLQTGKDIVAFLWLTGENHGETRYQMTIKVKPRQRRGDAEPTPVQQTVIDQLITQLNSGVDHVDEIAESLEASPFAPGTGDNSAVQINTEVPNIASGIGSVAFGAKSEASGKCSFAAGTYSGDQHVVASGQEAMAVGLATTASGHISQAFGQKTVASGLMSTAFGSYSIATGQSSFVIGQWNVPDENPVDTAHGSGARKYLFIVGNGKRDNRSNAATLDWDGNAVLAGKLTVGADPAGAMDVATKQYVDQHGGGSSVTVDNALSTTSENPVQNKVIAAALANKADDNIFIAEYGVTQNEDIDAAYQAGKTIVCKYNNALYPLRFAQEQPGGFYHYRFDFGGSEENGYRWLSSLGDYFLPVAEQWSFDYFSNLSTITPKMDGTAAVGTSDVYARGDHVHPTDTSRAAVSDLATKADKITEVTVSTAGAVTQALDAGKIYHFTGALTALTITLNAPASGQLAQYHFDFNSGSTAATLTMPNTVTMPDSFAPEASKHYEVDILNNYGAVVSWANS